MKNWINRLLDRLSAYLKVVKRSRDREKLEIDRLHNMGLGV